LVASPDRQHPAADPQHQIEDKHQHQADQQQRIDDKHPRREGLAVFQ